jgi:hypothetical protein
MMRDYFWLDVDTVDAPPVPHRRLTFLKAVTSEGKSDNAQRDSPVARDLPCCHRELGFESAASNAL